MSLRRPSGRRRPSPRSWCSRASSGAGGRSRGGRSSPEQSSRRRPELGLEWARATVYGEAGEEGEPTRESSQGTGRDDGELGGGADGGERRRRSTAAGGDEGDGDGSTGRSGLCGSAESFRARRRSSCACRRGEGEAVATATACGGDGSVRARWGNGEGENRGRVRAVGAARGVARGIQATRGRSRRWRGDVAPAGRVAARAGACPCPPGARKGTTGVGQLAGPACWAAGPGHTVPGRG